MLDSNGDVQGTYYYDAFGNVLETVGNVNNNITFAGYQWDKETGLYYLNARMYDPKIARFLQEDTYTGSATDPLSLNLYTYCDNEPIMYIDPTGHEKANVIIGRNGKNSVVNNVQNKNNVVTAPIGELVSKLGGKAETVLSGSYGYIRVVIPNYAAKPKNGQYPTMQINFTPDGKGNFKGPDNKIWKTGLGGLQVGVKNLAGMIGLTDTLSWWHEETQNNELQLLLMTDQKNSAVQIIRKENNITATLYGAFRTGVIAAGLPSSLLYEKSQDIYKQQILEGINMWDDDYEFKYKNSTKTKKIHFDVIFKETKNFGTAQQIFFIDIYPLHPDGSNAGSSPTWSVKSPVGAITLSLQQYPKQLKYVAAHEIGHVFGLADAYGGGVRPDAFKQLGIVKENNIMRGGLVLDYNLVPEISGLDVEMIWNAQVQSRMQGYSTYSADILDGAGHPSGNVFTMYQSEVITTKIKDGTLKYNSTNGKK